MVQYVRVKNMFKIMTDTMADLTQDFVDENEIEVLFMPYKIEERTYTKDYQMDAHMFYDKMREGFVPDTMPVTFEEARSKFGQLLKDYNEILYISFSSALSKSYENVAKAASEINEGVDNAKIIVIDSKSGSLGQGMILYKAVKMRAAGATIDQVAEYIEEHKLEFTHILTTEELVYLYRGNKIKKASLILSTITGVRPLLHLNENGEMVSFEKVRGRKNSIMRIVDVMEKSISLNREDNETLFIAHCDCENEAQMMAEEIKRRFGIENIIISMIGPAIGAHTGPGTIALFFRGNHR